MEWRSKPENSKQGSGAPIIEGKGHYMTTELDNYIKSGQELYQRAMDEGVAPELARLFLPAYGMYVRWRWTVSLHGVLSFLDQRLPQDAQYEIRRYAEAVKELTKNSFPYTYKVALEDD
jgi:thymidylate synthase (FAD)